MIDNILSVKILNVKLAVKIGDIKMFSSKIKWSAPNGQSKWVFLRLVGFKIFHQDENKKLKNII